MITLIRDLLFILIGTLIGVTALDVSKAAPWRHGSATWYGPSFYGHTFACGGRYYQRTRAVASMTLPCGTKVTIRNGIRIVRVVVRDTGAFHVTFDLTARTAMDLCRCWKPYTMLNLAWKRGW